MINPAVSAPPAHHADPDVDRPPGYAFSCGQITRFGTASGDRHNDLAADHIGGSVRVAGDRDDYATRQGLSHLSNPIADYVRASMRAWERITEHRSAVSVRPQRHSCVMLCRTGERRAHGCPRPAR
jgi:hypothetical protein